MNRISIVAPNKRKHSIHMNIYVHVQYMGCHMYCICVYVQYVWCMYYHPYLEGGGHIGKVSNTSSDDEDFT